MRYICFGYYDPKKVASLTQADMEAMPGECKPHDEALDRSGRKVALACLGEPETARSIRPTGGRPAVTEGAFHTTRDQIGVCFVVEAGSMDEAVAIASLHPSAHLGKYFGGGIEVRPCELFEVYSGQQGERLPNG